MDIANKGDPPETVLADVKGYEMSLDRKKMLVAKGEDFYILDSDVKAAALADPKALAKAKMDLSRWTFDTNPRAEFHELFPGRLAAGARLFLRPQHAGRRLEARCATDIFRWWTAWRTATI